MICFLHLAYLMSMLFFLLLSFCTQLAHVLALLIFNVVLVYDDMIVFVVLATLDDCPC